LSGQREGRVRGAAQGVNKNAGASAITSPQGEVARFYFNLAAVYDQPPRRVR